MAAAAILKITKTMISPQQYDRSFTKFGMVTQSGFLNRHDHLQFSISKLQDGGQPPV